MTWRAIVAEVGAREAVVLVGLALVTTGLWMIAPELALVAVGVLFIGAGAFPGRKA